MPTVKFTSIDKDERTVTFDVDGEAVTRKIPEQFEGTIEDYIRALARGLAIEYTAATPEAIPDPAFEANEVIE